MARGTIGRHCERMRRGNGGRWVRRRCRKVCDIVRSGELVVNGSREVGGEDVQVKIAKLVPLRPALAPLLEFLQRPCTSSQLPRTTSYRILAMASSNYVMAGGGVSHLSRGIVPPSVSSDVCIGALQSRHLTISVERGSQLPTSLKLRGSSSVQPIPGTISRECSNHRAPKVCS